MKKFLLTVTAGIFALLLLAGASVQPFVKAEARQTVVGLVENVSPDENIKLYRPTCSAVKISPTLLLTASHCVPEDPVTGADGEVRPAATIYWRENGSSELKEAVVAKIDRIQDMALLSVNTTCPCARLADTPLAVDDYVMFIGFPMGPKLNLQVVTEGSYQGRIDDMRDLTTALVIFGNSGGGAFNERGELIGVVIELVAAEGGFVSVPVTHLSIITPLDNLKEFVNGN